jgi:putative transposase
LVNDVDERRAALEADNERISIRRQCALLGLNRASAYYEKRPENPLNLILREEIGRQYMETPFYGVPRMTVHLRDAGFAVGKHRVRRLMRLMGLEAIYPKKRLSIRNPAHKIYPYLLRDVKVEKPDHVWSTDITYIGVRGGFAYLTVVMDWASRYVLSWELSNTLDASFCVEALERALSVSKPEIFNSDQGSQFTSEAFTGILAKAGIQISMDGRGRAYDNIFVERLWRTVKYEEVHLHEYENLVEARKRLERYFKFYNQARPHQSLDWRTPSEVYFENQEASSGPKAADAAATPVGLRPPSVAAASLSPIHLNSEQKWS